VHRLWSRSPTATPADGYAAKFAVPFCWRPVRLCGVGSAPSPRWIRDERVLALASKVKYVIDPTIPIQQLYGHIRATLQDGSVIEERQPHRGRRAGAADGRT